MKKVFNGFVIISVGIYIDFILDFAGAVIGFIAFRRTPACKLFKLRAW